MSVSEHLRINLDDYDTKIRTFVPHYERMIGIIADALAFVRGPEPTIVDLGIGTGALAKACLHVHPKGRLIGIDTDASMMESAKLRLSTHHAVEYRHQDFMETALPVANAFVACIALHHIRTPLSKQRFYRKVIEATAKGGMIVSGDCFPAVEPALARKHRVAWLAHLQQTYSPSESESFLQAWSGEDVYFPLDDEISWIREAGFRPEVLWREDGFGVVAGFREG